MRSKSEGIREAGRSGVISAATAIERGLRDDGGRGGGAQWRGERRDPPSREPQHLGTLARVRVVWIWAIRFPLENGESNSLVKRKDKARGEKIRREIVKHERKGLQLAKEWENEVNEDCGFFKWDEENAMNADKLQILKEENAKLRSKIVKEKEKRRRAGQRNEGNGRGTNGTKAYNCKQVGVAQNMDVSDNFLTCGSSGQGKLVVWHGQM
ncbi:hypothetical protein Cgig2_021831 [Carnegiea gigantea]|uniref:Uncharacterized protein n=1 Tax=Carnegiea gigantea TaxID=171969 RepID=A0A9Q1KLZ7_9CARY|nr:hypothetical protein Cgig2_021831 [Carnegiea gigantea]